MNGASVRDGGLRGFWLVLVAVLCFPSFSMAAGTFLLLEEETRNGGLVEIRFDAFPAPDDLLFGDALSLPVPASVMQGKDGSRLHGFFRNLVREHGTKRVQGKVGTSLDQTASGAIFVRSGVVFGPFLEHANGGARMTVRFAPSPLPEEWARLKRNRAVKDGVREFLSLFR